MSKYLSFGAITRAQVTVILLLVVLASLLLARPAQAQYNDQCEVIGCITSGPADESTVNTNSVTFGFTVSQGLTAKCVLYRHGMEEDPLPSKCTSPHTYSKLPNGAYKFSVEWYPDDCSYCLLASEPRLFKVNSEDNTEVVNTTIDSGPSGTVDTNYVTFKFSGTPSGGYYECSIDGAAWKDCDSPRDYSRLTNASHTFKVRAVDSAGNKDTTPASRTFRVSAPKLSLAASPIDIEPGSATTLSGTLTSPSGTALKNTRVILEQRQFGETDFSKMPGQPQDASGNVIGVLTDNYGKFQFADVKPSMSTEYRAKYAGSYSPIKDVQVSEPNRNLSGTTKTIDSFSSTPSYALGYKHHINFSNKREATMVGRDYGNFQAYKPYAVCLESVWVVRLTKKNMTSTPVLWYSGGSLTSGGELWGPFEPEGGNYDLPISTQYTSGIKKSQCEYYRGASQIWNGQQPPPNAAYKGLVAPSLGVSSGTPIASITHKSVFKIYNTRHSKINEKLSQTINSTTKTASN